MIVVFFQTINILVQGDSFRSKVGVTSVIATGEFFPSIIGGRIWSQRKIGTLIFVFHSRPAKKKLKRWELESDTTHNQNQANSHAEANSQRDQCGYGIFWIPEKHL